MDEWRASAVGDADTEPVTVPGTPESFAGADGVDYVTNFEDPREPDDDAAVVVLEGLYARAEVEVTGERLDGEGTVEHDAYFEPLRIPFLPFDENELSVRCFEPDDRFGGLHDTDAVPDEDAVPGIWWGASLETHPLPFIDRIRVRPELTEDGARLHVKTTVVSEDPIDDRITYSLKPEGDFKTRGMMDRGRVETAGPGRTTVEHTIDVRDPALWWPRELGAQHRYRLRAKLGDHERTVTTGICEVEHDEDRLVVNDRPVPIRGVNLLTTDPTDIDRAMEVNANLVRAPGHVLSPAVYEACDEAGMLVWQDLPLTGPGEFDVDRAEDLAATLGDAYTTHPSFAVAGTHDEPTDTFADGLGSGFLDGFRLRWRAWRTGYDRTPAETVAEAFPEGVPVVPVVGGPGVDHDAAAYYPGWDYGTPATTEALLERYPTDVVAAFGAGALADGGADDAESDGAIAGFDDAKHDRHVEDADDVEASQAYQSEVVRRVTETARRQRLGAVASALRDTDAAGMGVYANDGTPKAAQETLARAFQPVQAFRGDDPSEVVVVNDSPDAHTATLAWAAGDESGEEEVTVGGAGRWTGDLDIPSDADDLTLTVTIGGSSVQNTYD